jgi:hypothetical protein
MKTIISVPQVDVEQTIMTIVIIPGSSKIKGTIRGPNSSRVAEVEVDVASEWAGASAANKSVIKAFIKKLGAMLLEKYNESIGATVTSGDVEGEVWD